MRGVRKSFNVGLPSETECCTASTQLAAGEFCAVMGTVRRPGKSTLLNIVGLLDRPTAGELARGWRTDHRTSDRALTQLRGRSIGFVFQYHYLPSAFSAPRT